MWHYFLHTLFYYLDLLHEWQVKGSGVYEIENAVFWDVMPCGLEDARLNIPEDSIAFFL
jgi:hypothetical protein